MTDDAWIATVIAEAKPLDAKPEVHAICLEDYAEALRFCRAIGVTGQNNRSAYSDLIRMSL